MENAETKSLENPFRFRYQDNEDFVPDLELYVEVLFKRISKKGCICMLSIYGRDQIVRQIRSRNDWKSYESPLPFVISSLVDFGAACFIDVGANTGFYSIVAILSGYKEIRSFEPVPMICKILDSNIQLTIK